MTYQCKGCRQHYCVECEGGLDACPECSVGPFCDDCAIKHRASHDAEEEP